MLVPSALKRGAIDVSVGNVAAGATAWVTATIPSGQIPIAPAGYYVQGTNNTYCTVYCYNLDTNMQGITMALKNTASTAATITVTFVYLYI